MLQKVSALLLLATFAVSVVVLVAKVTQEKEIVVSVDAPEYVVVQPGDTYWLYAKRYYKSDPRWIAHLLEEANGTASGKLIPGNVIRLIGPDGDFLGDRNL